MHSTVRLLLAAAAFTTALGPALGGSTCAPDGLQRSGSIYRICMPAPEDYNGHLVLWAHGFQDAGTPVQIPEGQLDFGGVSLPEIVNSLGFGFATNSYSKTGLAIRQGIDDLLDLVSIFAEEHGVPEKIFVTGASEGGIITTLLIEHYGEAFAGGVAACGPVGSFEYQINYFGDSRATFEYFFPGLIPGDPFNPPQDLVDGWSAFYNDTVRPTALDPANRARLDQWVRVAKLPFDPDDYLDTVEQSMRDVLRYSVVNLNDAAETLGGFPYANRGRWYRGSNNDLLLNLFVLRVDASEAALHEMREFYDTSGELGGKLVTLHTRRDQQVPYAHEFLYQLKTLAAGTAFVDHWNIPIDRYGHCDFTAAEGLLSFALLLLYTGDLDVLSGVGSVLEGSELASFETLAAEHGLPYRIEGPHLGLD